MLISFVSSDLFLTSDHKKMPVPNVPKKRSGRTCHVRGATCLTGNTGHLVGTFPFRLTRGTAHLLDRPFCKCRCVFFQIAADKVLFTTALIRGLHRPPLAGNEIHSLLLFVFAFGSVFSFRFCKFRLASIHILSLVGEEGNPFFA